MSDLVRFGVAMERELLTRFDERIAARGYENRSEALRDLVRADLTRAAYEGGEVVTAILTLVFARKQRAEVARMLDQSAAGTVVCQMGMLLEDERALEVVVLKGKALDLMDIAGKLAGMRGVLGADLGIACAQREPARDPVADGPGAAARGAPRSTTTRRGEAE